MTKRKPPRQEPAAPAQRRVYGSEIPAAPYHSQKFFSRMDKFKFTSNDYLSIIGFSDVFKAWLKATSKKLALNFSWGMWLPQAGKGPVATLMSMPFVKTIM